MSGDKRRFEGVEQKGKKPRFLSEEKGTPDAGSDLAERRPRPAFLGPPFHVQKIGEKIEKEKANQLGTGPR